MYTEGDQTVHKSKQECTNCMQATAVSLPKPGNWLGSIASVQGGIQTCVSLVSRLMHHLYMLENKPASMLATPESTALTTSSFSSSSGGLSHQLPVYSCPSTSEELTFLSSSSGASSVTIA